MLEKNKIYNGDCLELMKDIKDKSIDMILCDLPYGTTHCKWDEIISFDELWKQYKRIIKDNGVIVLTSTQPFTTKLIYSNFLMFRYCWYWNKNQVTGFPFAKFQPLRCVEDICVFYKKAPTYNPQGLVKLNKPKVNRKTKAGVGAIYHQDSLINKEFITQYTNYPRQVLNFKCQREGLHPTQKPVVLFEYLIKTYTNEGDLVLDNCIGSGTTAVACINTNRNFIGIEKDITYCNIATQRIEK